MKYGEKEMIKRQESLAIDVLNQAYTNSGSVKERNLIKASGHMIAMLSMIGIVLIEIRDHLKYAGARE